MAYAVNLTRTFVKQFGLSDVSLRQLHSLSNLRSFNHFWRFPRKNSVHICASGECIPCIVHNTGKIIRLTQRVHLIRGQFVKIVFLTCGKVQHKIGLISDNKNINALNWDGVRHGKSNEGMIDERVSHDLSRNCQMQQMGMFSFDARMSYSVIQVSAWVHYKHFSWMCLITIPYSIYCTSILVRDTCGVHESNSNFLRSLCANEPYYQHFPALSPFAAYDF